MFDLIGLKKQLFKTYCFQIVKIIVFLKRFLVILSINKLTEILCLATHVQKFTKIDPSVGSHSHNPTH